MSQDLQRAESALFALDAGCPRDEWVKILTAAKSAGIEFDTADQWCSTAANYRDSKDVQSVWRGLRDTGGITESTLFYLARQAGWEDAKQSDYRQPLAPRKKPVSPAPASKPGYNPQAVWDSCIPADASHPYIVRKQGMADGLRTYPADAKPLHIAGQSVAGWLVLPCRTPAGELQSLQFIPPVQGKKLNLPGCTMAGGLHVVGEIPADGVAYVCEGISAAWAAWKATGRAAIVSFGWGNIKTIAPLLADHYPGLSLVLLPDVGKEDSAASIAADLPRVGWVALPHGMEQNSDVGDFAQAQGYDVLEELLSDGVKYPPKPEPFERDTLPTQWPANCLPGAMQQAAQAIAEHIQAPEPLAAMAVLAAVAHIAQRIANADHPKMGPMPCSLFVLSLANSGDRKSACFSLATRPIDNAEKEARQKHKRDYDAAMQERKGSRKKEEEPANELPSDPRTLYSDSTLEKIAHDFVKGSRPALSWSSDEAAQFFDGHSMKAETRAGALGVLTRLFDGRGVERDRVGQGLGSGYRFDVRFGLFLSGQPSVIASSLNDPLLREQGLLPRFILSSPTSLAGERFLDEASLSKRADADARLGQYWRILAKMNNAPWPTNDYDGLALQTATMTPEAKARWLVFYNATEARLSPETGDLTGSLQAFGGRAGELALRVATVFAVWRYYENAANKLEVLPDDIDRAASLVRYSLTEWLRLSNGHQLSATERDARDLLTFLQKKPEQWTCFTKQQLAQRGPGKLRSDSKRRTSALDELIRRKWLAFDGNHFTLASPTGNH